MVVVEYPLPITILTQDCEAVTCKGDLSDDDDLVVVAIYRPPNRDIIKF